MRQTHKPDRQLSFQSSRKTLFRRLTALRTETNLRLHKTRRIGFRSVNFRSLSRSSGLLRSRPNVRAGVNEGSFLPAATRLAASVDAPVVLVGGLRSLETVNEILARTRIEYIAFSRPLIRESNLINRWRAGDIRPAACVSCNACYRTSAHACLFTVNH